MEQYDTPATAWRGDRLQEPGGNLVGTNWRSHVRQPEPPTGLGSRSRWGVLLVRTGNAASLRKKSGATTNQAWGRDLFTGADRNPSLERSQENRNDSAFCWICIRKAGPIAG